VSTRESWPGEEPDIAAVESEAEAVEDDEVDADDTDADEVDAGEIEADESVANEIAGDADAEVAEPYDDDEDTGDEPELRIAGHEDGELVIPDDVDVLEGGARGTRRAVGVVVSRADVAVTNRLLESALAELDRAGVGREQVLVMAVPGAFELPIAAMALAKTRRYACIVALGSASDSTIVAGEAASGLQLAGLETGVPVSFGVLTDADADADARGSEAVRNALEMADLFQQLRATAQVAK
jgi:6,7-dimethyl-8-ribityllumazine synthase